MVTVHLHTTDSLHDGAIDVEKLFASAADKGITAIAITDHGSLTVVELARLASKKNGVKYIPGVEAYIGDNGKREHLVLLAKNLQGYKAISKAVTMSNRNVIDGFPIMTTETLAICFGPLSAGHNNVIALSACMAGVIMSKLTANFAIDKEIAKLKRKASVHTSPDDKDFLFLEAEFERMNEEFNAVSDRIKELTVIASKPYKLREKNVEKLKGSLLGNYEEERKKLDNEIAETMAAGEELEKLKTQKKKDQKLLTEKRQEYNKACLSVEKYRTATAAVDTLTATKQPEADLLSAAEKVIGEYVGIFGDGNFYAELQNHRLPEEVYGYPLLLELAKRLGLPFVGSNDVHVLNNSEADITRRAIIRSLRFNSWEEIEDADREMYLKDDEELIDMLSEIISYDDAVTAVCNKEFITDQCDVVFPEETHYPAYHGDAKAKLRELVESGIKRRYPTGWTDKHRERLEYEMNVIDRLGFNDYLCIVEDFLRYARLLGKLDALPTEVLSMETLEALASESENSDIGVGIGPGRGSAVGSLVCYLSGITSVDPVKYELLFERFLNEERVSMPDIDSDFRPDIRGMAIAYITDKYGENAVCRIMTRSTLKAKASFKAAARILGSRYAEKKDIFVALGATLSKAVPVGVDVTLADAALKDKFEDEDAREVIYWAELVENVFVNTGVHAAGVVVSDSADISEYAPLLAAEDGMVTQCDKDHVEEGLGLLKFDFLGLINLGVINACLCSVKKNHGVVVDIDDLPFEDEVFSEIFAKAKTNSVFQFESDGMKKLLKGFKPQSFEDIILLVAGYRPGPIQFLDDITAVKNGTKKPDYIIPEMEEVLGKTYGYPIYQEQIMQIFNKFAGFSLGESDIIRRYMSKKKADKFAAYKDKFIKGLIEHGATEKNAEKTWNEMLKFSAYAFNKSHASAYALIAYQTAWLKYHYPAEYQAAVMTYADDQKKVGMLISESRSLGITVLNPDVNLSSSAFVAEDGKIRMSLTSIKGLGNPDAIMESAPYTSLWDFVYRSGVHSDTCAAVIAAGALDRFDSNRQHMTALLPEYFALAKKIKDKENRLTTADEKQAFVIEQSIKELKAEVNEIWSPELPETNAQRLAGEKDVLGAFVSGHPLDGYGMPADYRCKPVMSATDVGVFIDVMGVIENLRIVNRKSDGLKLAFFDITDRSGSIPVAVFTRVYAEFADEIDGGNVVKVSGKIVEDTEDGVEEPVLRLVGNKVTRLKEMTPDVVISLDTYADWNAVKASAEFKTYLTDVGYSLSVYVREAKKIIKTSCIVAKEIQKRYR